jgi:signal transduction histidine kinase
MLSMLKDSQVDERIDLDWISSHHQGLYKEIMAFCHSGAVSTTKNIVSGHDSEHALQVFMHRICYFPCRIMIMLSAPEKVNDCNAEKVQWAEISRRLSHHVRRHISNILLALSILDNNPDPTEQAAKREMIRIEVDRIKRFTQAFQRFSEMGEYQLKEIDIVPWLENSISRFHVQTNIEVIKDWSLASLPTLIEPIRFEEVMINILTNAIESMPDGGTLRVSLAACTDNKVLIEIEDSGIGIPEKYLTDIWQPFFTTKQSGTGIGLPEVKKILCSMHGEIELISEEGIGTTVPFC